MVIDHVRYFLSSARFDPTDPAQTTIGLFFTRWVTHFCAPVFMLLAGAGAYLVARARPHPEGRLLVSPHPRALAPGARADRGPIRLAVQPGLRVQQRPGFLGAGLVHDRARGIGLAAAAVGGRHRAADGRRAQPLRWCGRRAVGFHGLALDHPAPAWSSYRGAGSALLRALPAHPVDRGDGGGLRLRRARRAAGTAARPDLCSTGPRVDGGIRDSTADERLRRSVPLDRTVDAAGGPCSPS